MLFYLGNCWGWLFNCLFLFQMTWLEGKAWTRFLWGFSMSRRVGITKPSLIVNFHRTHNPCFFFCNIQVVFLEYFLVCGVVFEQCDAPCMNSWMLEML